jgi:uroporphyrinogen decarboxylase
MNSSERVLAAMHCQMPDRVPFIDTIDLEMQFRIMGRRDFDQADLAAEMGFDALMLNRYPPFFVHQIQTGSGSQFIKEPLIRTRADLDQAVFPELDNRYIDEVAQFVDRYHKTGYALGLVTRMGAAGILNSMGLDNFSYALADDPGLVETLFDRYADWACELLEKTRNLGFDFIKFADDIAYKSGPMFSPQVFRELFLPRMRRVAAQVSLPWIYHSDGNLMPVFDDLLSLGMNVINPIEPGAMDIEAVKEQYGTRLCLHGNIDLHYTLTLGTPEEVTDEVRRRIERIGKGGGYIIASANSITDYCKLENVLAMRDAIRQYGSYANG